MGNNSIRSYREQSETDNQLINIKYIYRIREKREDLQQHISPYYQVAIHDDVLNLFQVLIMFAVISQSLYVWLHKIPNMLLIQEAAREKKSVHAWPKAIPHFWIALDFESSDVRLHLIVKEALNSDTLPTIN